MNAEATGLIEEGGRVAGLRAQTRDGELEIRADLVIGCDGRHSTLRERAGFEVEDIGAPIDVLWFRLSRREATLYGNLRPSRGRAHDGHAQSRRLLAMRLRDSQGRHRRVKGKGLPVFRDAVVEMSPFLRDRAGEIKDWDDIKLLTVAVDRLRQWHKPGPVMHRRCGTCDVADRRRRHQSGGAGRGRRGEYPGRAAQGGPCYRASISRRCSGGASCRCA